MYSWIWCLRSLWDCSILSLHTIRFHFCLVTYSPQIASAVMTPIHMKDSTGKLRGNLLFQHIFWVFRARSNSFPRQFLRYANRGDATQQASTGGTAPYLGVVSLFYIYMQIYIPLFLRSDYNSCVFPFVGDTLQSVTKVNYYVVYLLNGDLSIYIHCSRKNRFWWLWIQIRKFSVNFRKED